MDSTTRDLEHKALAGDASAAIKLVEERKRGDFDSALQGFVERLRGALVAHTAKNYPMLKTDELRTETGPKYVRVWKGSSAYCFVSRETGDILKPGGWKSPEPKKIPRGNIFAADPLAGCGPYGVAYANGSGHGGGFTSAGNVPIVEAPKPAPTFTPAKLEKGATVRARETFGSCRVLGVACGETLTHWKYRDASTGKTKLAKKDADGPYARGARPSPHTVPCKSCPENWPEGACMHGRVGQCETCMSM